MLSLQKHARPDEHTKDLSARLAEALSGSQLHFWKPGDPVARLNRRVLIGVAPYSRYDVNLLAALDELQLDSSFERIDIFDVLACQSQADFEKYIPGIEKVYQTPVVGLWENRRLVQHLSGNNARELLMRMYDIDEARIR